LYFTTTQYKMIIAIYSEYCPVHLYRANSP